MLTLALLPALLVSGCGQKKLGYTHEEMVLMEEAVSEFIENPLEINSEVAKRLRHLTMLPKDQAREVVLSNIQHRFNAIDDFVKIVPVDPADKFQLYLTLGPGAKTAFRSQVADLVYAELRIQVASNALKTNI